jgi:hypothetical protein
MEPTCEWCDLRASRPAIDEVLGSLKLLAAPGGGQGKEVIL